MPNTKAQSLMLDLQKTFGEEAVMMASDIPVGPPVSTGSLALDFATGYGGFPQNRVVEIYGRPGTGKTTLALLTMLNALEKNPTRGALFLDVEHKITPDWLELLVGREIMDKRLIYIRPTSIENATNIYRKAVGSGAVCCAVLDSIAGSPTIRRSDDAETGHYGGNAIGVGEFARTACTLSDVYDCLTIGINQVRVNMNPRAFSDLTGGGEAWKHACILRIELVRGGDTEDIKFPGEEKPVPIGYTIFAKIRKNQVGAPGRTAMYWFFNVWTPERGFGVDTLDEITRLGIKTRVFTLKGGWYHHQAFPVDSKGEHKINGLQKVKEIIRSDESLKKTLVGEVLARLAEHASEVAPMSDPEAPIEIGALLLDGGAPK